jgi:type II secretory pathway pseudopilin PulG
MKKILCKNQKAFTIIETLVAIFILSLSITGPLFYVSNTFQLARISKYKMTAYFLATETLEEIKYERDFVLGNRTPGVKSLGGDWIEKVSDVAGDEDYFDWDKDNDNFKACNESGSSRCNFLHFIPGEGYFYDDGSAKSVYYRHAQILETGNLRERQIIVTVGWNDGIINGELEVFEYIYDFNT